MSIFPKFQPILFEEYSPSNCYDQNDFQVLAEQGDSVTFQAILSPCAGIENIIVNPTFDPSDSSDSQWAWTFSGGMYQDTPTGICKDNDGSTGYVTKSFTFISGNSYQMQIYITSLVGYVKIKNGAQSWDIRETGLYTFNFTAQSQEITITFEDSESYGCIAWVNAYPFSQNVAFGIIDSDGDTAGVYDLANYPDYFLFSKDRVTVLFPWSDMLLADGCYQIGFTDGCSNLNGQLGIFNNDFESCFAGWTQDIGTLTDISCTLLENPDIGEIDNCIDFSNSGNGGIYSTATTLGVGITYTVTMGAFSTDADGFIRVYCGTAYDDFTASGESHDIICTGNQTFRIEAHLQTSTYIRIWNIEVSLTDTADFQFDYESNSFKLKEDHVCTHLINLSNDDDGMGFVFENTQFAPQLRLDSQLQDVTFEEQREVYLDNLGKKTVYFGETRPRYAFAINAIPAWLVHFIALCRIADHFFIDGTEYFIEGDGLDPQKTDGAPNILALIFEVSEKEILLRNANIGNEERPVAANQGSFSLGVPVEQAGSDSIIVELPTGDTVGVK